MVFFWKMFKTNLESVVRLELLILLPHFALILTF